MHRKRGHLRPAEHYGGARLPHSPVPSARPLSPSSSLCVRIILREYLSGRVPSIRTCRGAVYIRCGQDNDSVELIWVLCSPCAHPGRPPSRLVSFHVLYEVVRKTEWVNDDVTPFVGSELSSKAVGCYYPGEWCFLCGSGREKTCFDGNEREQGRKLYQKRKLVYGWGPDHIIKATTLSSSQHTWETNTPSPTAALNSPRSSSEYSLLDERTLERHPSCRECATRRTVRWFIVERAATGKRKRKRRCVANDFCNRASLLPLSPQIQLDPSMDVSDTRSLVRLSVSDCWVSAVITRSRMNLCSPIIRDIFSTIPADSSVVATRSWRLCSNSFDERPRKYNWKTDYTRFGMVGL